MSVLEGEKEQAKTIRDLCDIAAPYGDYSKAECAFAGALLMILQRLEQLEEAVIRESTE